MNEEKKVVTEPVTTHNNYDAKLQQFPEFGKNIQGIAEELSKYQEQLADNVIVDDGLFVVKSANEWMKEAAQRPDPKPLWRELWYEGEMCCLFADTNVGKSIYAVQMAAEIATTHVVLYWDFELSDKQFQLRYSDDNGRLYQFPNNLYRIEVNPCRMDLTTFEAKVIENMEQTAIKYKSDVIIIDNLTWIASNVEKGDAAGLLMMKLSNLKRQHGWSILVLSHTPKRDMTTPITQNNLSGSKRLANFFDSMFAMGFSAKEENLRYVKQIKCRFGKFSNGAKNVIVGEICKDDGFLHLKFICNSTEKEHLKEPNAAQQKETESRMIHLRKQGFSMEKIANELSISKSRVQRFFTRMIHDDSPDSLDSR